MYNLAWITRPDHRTKTTPHQNVHNLSQQVHRIGFHFPNAVIDSVCRKYGIRLTSKGTVVGDGNFDSFGNGLHNSEPEKDQLTINTEARDAIRDLFPNIPDNDLFQIIKTAFQKGQRKVGTANELPLARRAQLAVVAHIRHIYTDYDKLLRSGSYHDARGIVEVPTLDKLMEWRGDDENGTKELEDVIREVVVISDEEDSDDDDVEDQGRDNSVEVISSNAIADQVQTRPVDFSNSHSTEAEDSHHHLSDEAPSGFRYIPQVARRKAVPDKRKEDRRGFSRYQAWNQAKERLRRVPNDNRQPPLPAHQIVGRLRDPTSDLAGETASQDFLPAPQERNTYSSHLTPLPSDHRSTIAQLDNRRPFYSDHLIDQSRYGRRLVSGDEVKYLLSNGLICWRRKNRVNANHDRICSLPDEALLPRSEPLAARYLREYPRIGTRSRGLFIHPSIPLLPPATQFTMQKR